MASIKPRTGKNGITTYLITVSMGRDTNGKKKFETTTFKPTKTTPKAIEKEVQKFALDFEERVKSGKYFSGEKITFHDVAKQWEPDAKENLSIATFESYQGILQKHIYPVIGALKISKINAMVLQNMVKGWKAEELSTASIRRYFAVVSLVFRYAYRLGIIEINPCDRVELPKQKSLSETNTQHLEPEEVLKFLDIVENGFTINHPEKIRKNGTRLPAYSEEIKFSLQWVAYFHLAINSGLRRGETVALTWNDIDFNNRTVNVEKARSRTKEGTITKEPKSIAGYRVVPVTEHCINILKAWKKEQRSMMLSLGNEWQGKTGRDFNQNNVFIQIKNGLPMDLSTPSHKFKEIIQMYNSTCTNEADKLPDIGLHGLRHTYASFLYASGVDIETSSYLLGHSKTSVTLDVYGHPLKKKGSEVPNKLEPFLSRKQA